MSRLFARCAGLRYVAVALAGAGAMLVAVGYALMHGNLAAEGGRLIGMPWGIVTLVDVYVGLILFSGWVLWREASRIAAAAWIAVFLAGGNLATCCYVIKAAIESRRDSGRFWMGKQHAS